MPSMLCNALIAVASVAAWLSIVRGRGTDQELAARGAGSLKYYTVLSNFFSAAACVLYLVCCLVPGRTPAPWLLMLKLASATTVMITFGVTAVLLVPVYGAKSMYDGGNFWLHLVCPLLSVADLCLLVPIAAMPFWGTLGPVAFTALYAVGYVRAVLVHGPEENGKVYDFYGFTRWGEDKILVVAAIMLLITWLIALALYGLGHLLYLG